MLIHVFLKENQKLLCPNTCFVHLSMEAESQGNSVKSLQLSTSVHQGLRWANSIDFARGIKRTVNVSDTVLPRNCPELRAVFSPLLPSDPEMTFRATDRVKHDTVKPGP